MITPTEIMRADAATRIRATPCRVRQGRPASPTMIRTKVTTSSSPRLTVRTSTNRGRSHMVWVSRATATSHADQRDRPSTVTRLHVPALSHHLRLFHVSPSQPVPARTGRRHARNRSAMER